MGRRSAVPEAIVGGNRVPLARIRDVVGRFQRSFKMFVQKHPQLLGIFNVVPQVLLLSLDPLVLVLHHLVFLPHLFLLVLQGSLLPLQVSLFLLQNADLLPIEINIITLLVNLIVLMSDLLIENAVILRYLPQVSLRLCPNLI